MSEMTQEVTAEAPATEPEIVAKPAEETAQAEEKTEQVEDKKLELTQSQLDKIVQKAKGKERAITERRELQKYADKLESMSGKSAEAVHDGRPVRENYNSDGDFIESLTDWKQDERDRKAAFVSLTGKTDKIYASAFKDDANFDRETFDELVTPAMAQAIIDSDVSVKVMVHLSKNPDEMERIAKFSPARQAAEIGKLEINLEKVKVRVSNAPDPINPIGTRSGGGAVSKEKASMDEYIAIRKAEKARWAR